VFPTWQRDAFVINAIREVKMGILRDKTLLTLPLFQVVGKYNMLSLVFMSKIMTNGIPERVSSRIASLI
jgi:hypothetical protein